MSVITANILVIQIGFCRRPAQGPRSNFEIGGGGGDKWRLDIEGAQETFFY